MRSLTDFSRITEGEKTGLESDDMVPKPFSAQLFEKNLQRLKNRWHSGCLLNNSSSAKILRFWFDSDGALCGQCTINADYQGYDNIVHGGVLAALVDASMAQCLMGHNVVAYTAELNIKYRMPVSVEKAIQLRTKIQDCMYKKVFKMKTHIKQNGKTCVSADAKFFRTDSQSKMQSS